MSELNILHFSTSPLVGAPGKISDSLREIGNNSEWVIFSDYPNNSPLHKLFSSNALKWDVDDKAIVNTIESRLLNTDIVHIHNDFPTDLEPWLLSKSSKKAKFIYHVHSPLSEGPLYYDRTTDSLIPYSKRLVVAQYQPRHYPDWTPVPNIIRSRASIKKREKNQPLKLMFTPTHSRPGRWNSKGSEKTNKVISGLQDLGIIEVFSPKDHQPPHALKMLRDECQITIDEVATGAFHQVSLEGLLAGNIVINGSDFFTNSIFQSTINSDAPPPFLWASEDTLAETLLDLFNNPEKCNLLQERSYEFSEKNLNPSNLAELFQAIYCE